MRLAEQIYKIRDFISRRRNAYCKTFMPTGEFAPYAEEVLVDLARFCRAHDTCFQVDPRAHAVAEGRREVWLRIARNLHLSDAQLWELHGAANAAKESSREG